MLGNLASDEIVLYTLLLSYIYHHNHIFLQDQS